MQDNSFNHTIEEKLKDLQLEPSAAVWTAVEKELDRKKRRYFFAWWWLLPALLLLCGGITWLATGNRNSSNDTTKHSISAKENNHAPKENTPATATTDLTTTTAPAATGDENIRADENKNTGIQISRTNSGRKAAASVKISTPSFTEEGSTTAHLHKLDEKGGKHISISNATPEEEKAQDDRNETIVSTVITAPEDSLQEQGMPSSVAKKEEPVKKDSITPKAPEQTGNSAAQKKKDKKTTRWETAWTAGGGVAAFGSLSLGGARADFFTNSGVITSTPNGIIRTTEEYDLKNGLYAQAGFLAGRSLNAHIKWFTGLQYNYQQLDITKSLRVDSAAMAGSPSYSNISSSTSNEKLYIHSADIPLLVRFSIGRHIQLNTGLYNRIQFASNWNNYDSVLGKQKNYLPVLHFSPAFNKGNIAAGPFINIGLTPYAVNKRLFNYGLVLRYAPKK
ncbi:MAG: hypothetical protein QM687_03030 [Ferruginibacter sp.]